MSHKRKGTDKASRGPRSAGQDEAAGGRDAKDPMAKASKAMLVSYLEGKHDIKPGKELRATALKGVILSLEADATTAVLKACLSWPQTSGSDGEEDDESGEGDELPPRRGKKPRPDTQAELAVTAEAAQAAAIQAAVGKALAEERKKDAGMRNKDKKKKKKSKKKSRQSDSSSDSGSSSSDSAGDGHARRVFHGTSLHAALPPFALALVGQRAYVHVQFATSYAQAHPKSRKLIMPSSDRELLDAIAVIGAEHSRLFTHEADAVRKYQEDLLFFSRVLSLKGLFLADFWCRVHFAEAKIPWFPIPVALLGRLMVLFTIHRVPDVQKAVCFHCGDPAHRQSLCGVYAISRSSDDAIPRPPSSTMASPRRGSGKATKVLFNANSLSASSSTSSSSQALRALRARVQTFRRASTTWRVDATFHLQISPPALTGPSRCRGCTAISPALGSAHSRKLLTSRSYLPLCLPRNDQIATRRPSPPSSPSWPCLHRRLVFVIPTSSHAALTRPHTVIFLESGGPALPAHGPT